ncbi:hypothetical protein HK098_002690 [Nowakowskiella sp. JEL0407]|nr:hypothetical protein HK098_002690 [Nowakowskiella sp. JEL0407]
MSNPCYSCIRLSEKIVLKTFNQGEYYFSNFIGGRCASDCPPLADPGPANSNTPQYKQFLSQIGIAADVRGCFYGKNAYSEANYGFYHSSVIDSGDVVNLCPVQCISEAQKGRPSFTQNGPGDDYLQGCGDTFPSYIPKLTTTISTSPSVTDVIKSNNNSETSIGAIVGGSIAGAIVIIAVVLGAVFFIRRHNTAKNEAYRTLEPTALIGTEDQVVEIASDQTDGKEDNFVEIM